MCAHARRPHWPCVKRGRHLTRGPLSLASCAEPRNVTHKPEAPRALSGSSVRTRHRGLERSRHLARTVNAPFPPFPHSRSLFSL